MGEMKIELTDDKPVHLPPYRLAHSERQLLKDLISDLKRANIDEDSHSPYSSPVILVKKKKGDMRMCVDYRFLNAKTVKDHHPLPLIDDQLEKLHGMQFFTMLDLMRGYYQVPMDPQSRDKTAFSTPDGHYQYKRMPFGLTNAPATFRRIMNSVNSKLGRDLDVASPFLDHFIIYAMSYSEAIEKLQIMLQALREANLTLNFKKCSFMKNTMNYLGFEVSTDGIRQGVHKIESIASFP